MAPAKVQTGPDARIGETIEIGKCLSAKNAQIHEIPTISDFRTNNPCSLADSGAA